MIVVLDLETTGLDEHTGHILELAMVLCDDEFTVLDTFTSPVRLPKDLTVADVDGTVLNMHAVSGLWADCRDAPGILTTQGNAYAVLEENGAVRGDVCLAGSGISHFDRRWLKYHMPGLESWFHPRHQYDVGVVRRFAELAGVPWIEDAKTHRALDDALHHVDECRYAMGLLRSSMPYVTQQYAAATRDTLRCH